jgi:quinol monooxygenase YgiN
VCISKLLAVLLLGADPTGGHTMSKVSMMGTVTCRDGKSDQMEAVLRAMVDAARQEPAVEIYSYHRGDGNTFWFFALMTDEASMQGHGKSEAMQAAMAAFGPLMAGPPQMSAATPIAAIGFEI